jgi:hemerythrin HHE cation binding domain-containing protein
MTETTQPAPAATPASAEPDLAAFLMAHRGFRSEFGRLATVARAPRDAAHAALIDDQIALVMHLLHHHHTAEDTSLWPTLLTRVPEAAAALGRLEAQHEDMDPLFALISDTSRPLPDRAAALQELHEVLNAHLDEEEREAIPLIRRHMSRAEWETDGEEVMKSLDRARLPLIFGWLASVSDAEQTRVALAGVPLVPRLLFRLLWGPSYAKRFRALYGDLPTGPPPVRVLS